MKSLAPHGVRRLLAVVTCVGCLLAGGGGVEAQVPPEIEISQLHLFITATDDGIQVAEYHLISNGGDVAYEGVENAEAGARVTLVFRLPPGAEALDFDGPGIGERFVALDGGFGDTQPIPPGSTTVRVLFSYRLPVRDGMTLERTFSAPVASAAILVTDETLAIEGAGVRPTGSVDTEIGPARAYAAGPLPAGETLDLTFVAAPQEPASPGAVRAARNPSREVVVGLLSLLIALPVAYILLRPPVRARTPPAALRPLVDEIARLDQAFEAGALAPEAYRRRREDLVHTAREALVG